jgi:hypothetical protein
MSNTASRTLVEVLSAKGVTILVAHDFDKSGFTIMHTLCHDTRRFSFKAKPKVIDIGLRLEDALEMGLESEDVTYSADPRELLRKQGATEAEANFLVHPRKDKEWRGKRIELNAMPSKTFIDWLERGLQENGVEKVIPDEALIKETYQHAVLKERFIKQYIAEKVDDIAVPDDFRERITEMMAKNPEMAWDEVLIDLAIELANVELKVAA